MSDYQDLNPTTDSKYHLAISLKDQTCIIVGFGEVGQRKLHGLLKTDVAEIKIFDPALEIKNSPAILNNPKVLVCNKKVSTEDLLSATLVFACTNDNIENERIAAICRQAHILCNCTSSPSKGQITIPSVISLGGLTLTISTAGGSPALSKKWRQELEEWVGKRSLMVKLMAELRPLILSLNKDSNENRRLFRDLAYSNLEELLSQKQFQAAHDLLERYLPNELKNSIAHILATLQTDQP